MVSPGVSLCSQCSPIYLFLFVCVCGRGPPFLVLLVPCSALPTHLPKISSSPHPVCSPASHSLISHTPYISVPFPLFLVSLSVLHTCVLSSCSHGCCSCVFPVFLILPVNLPAASLHLGSINTFWFCL